MSPGVRQSVRSSCGSTPLDVDESNAIHVVDFITSCVPVKLYIQQQWTTDKVAIGQAWPPTSDVIHIECPVETDRPRLDQNLNTFVAWRKKWIRLVDEPSDDEDEDDLPHSSSQPRDDLPLPPPPPPQSPRSASLEAREQQPPSPHPPPPNKSSTPPRPASPEAREQQSPPPLSSQDATKEQTPCSAPQHKETAQQCTSHSSRPQKRSSSSGVSNAPKETQKKEMNASITSLMKKKKKEDEPPTKEAKLRFLKRIAVFEKPGVSDFDRQIKSLQNKELVEQERAIMMVDT
ncbi:hypothetical protein PVAP13_7NG124713 [Panicum virgatum]|uniref:Uncharacterized protein n=1 Tax=Panicum virgatum TaxID=38727 RepID=A0A8T0PVK0_PANVG|nr:hypothetical protein PVAP13_7NG124713 [Panicum virgatum]